MIGACGLLAIDVTKRNIARVVKYVRRHRLHAANAGEATLALTRLYTCNKVV